MKKKLIFLGLFLIGTTFSCSKPDNNEDFLAITDGASLSNALIVEGSTVKQGDIPSPGSSGYGNSMELQTTSVILTPLSQFQFKAFAPGVRGLLFLQIDGADEYFEIPFESADGSMNASIEKHSQALKKSLVKLSSTNQDRITCSPTVNLKLNARPMAEPQTYNATVQTFTMPTQTETNGDFSNIYNWSPPRQVQFKTFPTGTGQVTITLTWDKNYSDVDLWLEEPNGNKISYLAPTSPNGGQLDYDNTIGYGPENIFYASDANMLRGQYAVKVHYFSGFYSTGPVNYSVVVQNGSSVNSYQGSLNSDEEVDLVTTFSK